MKNILLFCAFAFVLCGIIYPTAIFISDKILPNSDSDIIYVDGSIVGSEVLNQDFSSEMYFHTDNIRPYITLNEAQKQKQKVMEVNGIDEATMEELIQESTFNNLYFEYVNITTLNINIYKLSQ